MTDPEISLKVVTAPAIGVVLHAPPMLVASGHSVDYTCGRCGTVLLHAEETKSTVSSSTAQTAVRIIQQNIKVRSDIMEPFAVAGLPRSSRSTRQLASK
jgi:hypothetical protein